MWLPFAPACCGFSISTSTSVVRSTSELRCALREQSTPGMSGLSQYGSQTSHREPSRIRRRAQFRRGCDTGLKDAECIFIRHILTRPPWCSCSGALLAHESFDPYSMNVLTAPDRVHCIRSNRSFRRDKSKSTNVLCTGCLRARGCVQEDLPAFPIPRCQTWHRIQNTRAAATRLSISSAFCMSKSDDQDLGGLAVRNVSNRSRMCCLSHLCAASPLERGCQT